MPPLAPPPQHGDKCGGSGGSSRQRQRSASFHGRGAEQQQRHHHQLQKQRPKTMPDLLVGARGAAASFRSGSSSPPPRDGGGETTGRRTPSKVLVSVTVQSSMWPLHVMASADWTVADLVAAAVALYVKEGRRPPLPSGDPAAFGLHYSQFSLEGTSGPKGEGYGTRLQELLPVPQIFRCRSSCSIVVL
ncbi:hypothetical protein HU200_053014 [Digitaria exilis]|uniref:DUF7054 domain-containing protein n=1 Tax=Digitaria exilis TaxID=1010633 RepID=A0A835E5F5_9POAL|nr:hypothetical protein HU200_053014 [Digitaria exilis]